MGQLAAASLAQEVLNVWNPKILLLVGIAGGLDHTISLGDVVASEQIVDYELGKVSSEGFGPRWSVYRTDAALLARIRGWTRQNWQTYVRSKRPRGNAKPHLHTGVYLSGNKVIADERSAGALRAVWRKAAAIDMEAAGIASVLYHRQTPPGFLVIKGICDYADSKKNDDWQEYAADAAASCAYSFVLDQLEPADLISTPATSDSTGELALRGLRLALAEAFDLGELKTLCFDLNVDWDEIPGVRKSEKIVELVKHLTRRRKLEELIRLVNQERDNILKAYSQDGSA